MKKALPNGGAFCVLVARDIPQHGREIVRPSQHSHRCFLSFLIRINGFAALQNKGATSRRVSVFTKMGAIFRVIAKKLPLKPVKPLGFPFPARPFSIYTFESDVLRCCCDRHNWGTR
ncbi:hypothetical protein RZ517_05195 [Roseovarius sp. S88]|uniref:Uncharacterized protein n=1 Tax=Roseovarius phycicola TaxID=3080976 RepID=A0ABZ2HLV2_9RHOB